MGKTAIYVQLLAVCSYILSGCSEDIELKLSSSQPRLVVDGHLCDMVTPYNYVRLTISADYFSNEKSPAVSGARVVVSDGEQDYKFEESKESGYYIAPAGFVCQQGKKYELSINGVDADDDGQDESYSAESIMPPTYEIDSINCTYDKYLKRYKVGLYAREDTTMANFYMFGIAYNDSLLANTYTKLSKTKDEWFSSDYCWGATIYMFDREDIGDDKMKDGDKANIKLYAMSISEEFYKYVDAIDDISTGASPMFSSTPANASGNISGGALGFFTTFAVVSVECEMMVKKEK